MDEKKNGGAVIVEEFAINIVEVNGVSERGMSLKLKVTSVMENVFSSDSNDVNWRRSRNSGG